MIQVRYLISFGWLLVGASLLGASTRLTLSAAAWIALIALLHGSRAMPFASGMAALWIALFAALSVSNRGIIPVPGVAYFVTVALLTATFALPFAVDRLVAPRLGLFATTLVFPMAWVAVEFLRARFTPSATWNSIAYTQYGNLPVMQLAAIGGLWGISFVIAWLASTFDWAWTHQFEWSVVRGPVTAGAALLALTLLGGGLRVAMARTDRASIRAVALNRPLDLFVPGEMTRITEGNVSIEERPDATLKLHRLHEWFLQRSRQEARAGARLIVWPEGNLLVFAEEESTFIEHAKRVAADERIYLAIGMGTIHLDTPLPFENKLVMIDPMGRVIVSYLKSHPVVGWEASIMRRGDGRVPVAATSDGRIAGVICFDADFPAFVRQASQAESDLLIVPANDWADVKDLHAQMAAFRAIENGVPLVRAAASGISNAFDPWGRVLGVADFFAPGDRTMSAQVAVGRVATLYATIGDLFAWLCIGGTMAAVVMSMQSRAMS